MPVHGKVASSTFSERKQVMTLFSAPSSQTRTRSEQPIQLLRLAIFVVLSSSLALAMGYRGSRLFTIPDVEWYIALAEGHVERVMQPFATRQLQPLLVRGLSHLTGFSVYSIFIALGVVSIVTVLTIVGGLLLRSGTPMWILIATGGCFFWADLVQGLALPDLWYAALLAIMLYALANRQTLAAVLMLFPLSLSRESTLLVLLCLLLAAWRRLSVVERVLAFVATFAGSFITARLSANALQNQQHVPASLYLLGKIPWNFLKNIAGVTPWTPRMNICVPTWQIHLPFGPIKLFGICGFGLFLPLMTVFDGLTRFGLFPLLLLLFFPVRTWRSLWSESLFLRFCLVYGVISFLLAPMLGATVPRLFGYAWPLFMLAVPACLPPIFKSGAKMWGFLAIHLIVSYLPEMGAPIQLSLPLAIVGYVAGWRLLRMAKEAPETQPVAILAFG